MLVLKPDFHLDICIIDYLNLILIIKVNSHNKYMMKMKIMTFDYGVTI